MEFNLKTLGTLLGLVGAGCAAFGTIKEDKQNQNKYNEMLANCEKKYYDAETARDTKYFEREDERQRTFEERCAQRWGQPLDRKRS